MFAGAALENVVQGLDQPGELHFHPGRVVGAARFQGAYLGGDADDAAAVDDEIRRIGDAALG